MTLEHSIRLLAGSLVLAGLALGWWVHPAWFFLTVFVGLNLVQSAMTKWCLAEDLLKRYVYGRSRSTQ